MSQTIDIRVTIDTASLPPSQSQDDSGGAASPLSANQDQGYMVATAGRAIEQRGAGEVAVEADAGDTLRFFISSGSNNFEQPVLIESIPHTGGDEVLTELTSQVVERPAIAPESPAEELTVQLVQRRFHFFQCAVASGGSGDYDLVFVLYGRDEEAQPLLVSHYRWAMRLTVNSNRRES